MLNVVDEFTHESIAIRIERKLKSIDVIEVLASPPTTRGVPEPVLSDNGPEFIATAVQKRAPSLPTSRQAVHARMASSRAQCKVARWTSQPPDRRGLASALQHSATPCIPRVSCACSSGVRADACRSMAVDQSAKSFGCGLSQFKR